MPSLPPPLSVARFLLVEADFLTGRCGWARHQLLKEIDKTMGVSSQKQDGGGLGSLTGLNTSTSTASSSTCSTPSSLGNGVPADDSHEVSAECADGVTSTLLSAWEDGCDSDGKEETVPAEGEEIS